MRSLFTRLTRYVLTLSLTLFFGCNGGCPLIPGTPLDPNAPHASGVTLYNCTVDNQPTEPPSGRAYSIFAQYSADNPNPSGWGYYGQLNALLTQADCHTVGGNTVVVPFKGQAGIWEIRAIKIPKGDEPSCNTQTVDGGCSYVSRQFIGDAAAPMATSDFTSVDQ